MTPHSCPSPRHRDDGTTLVETLVTCLVLSLAFAAVVPILVVFDLESTAVLHTYGAVDQVLLASEILNQYIRDAVEPGPPTSGVPVPPFSSASGNSATFYADTGNPTGPERVVARVTTSANGVQTFLVTATAADADSCPMTGSTGTACTYLTAAPRDVADVADLVNGATPIFTYTLTSGVSTSSPSTSCASGAGNCPLDSVDDVAVDLQAGGTSGNTAGYQSLAHVFAPTFNPAVG